MMKNKKMLIIALAVILVAVAALVGTLIWRFGGETPNPTEPGITTPVETNPTATNPSQWIDPDFDPDANATIPVGTVPPGVELPTGPNELVTEPTDPPVFPTDPTNPTEPPVPDGPLTPNPDDPTEPGETAPEETAPPDGTIVWTEVDETVYALEIVRLYEEADEQSERIGKLKQDESVRRVAISDHGWSRLIYKGKEVYANSSLLATEKPTKPSDPDETVPDDTEYITMYVQAQTTARTGPGEGYDTVCVFRKGDVICVVPNSEENGWVKIRYSKTFAYVKEKHLGMEDPNAATEPTEDPDDPWSRYVQDADPETGISWDGESPIIYIYEDGSTGTERRHGAKYEKYPGGYAIWLDPEQLHGDDGDRTCEHCGKPGGDGTDGTCARYLHDVTCPNCGEHVKAGECHYCDGD